MQPVVEGAVRLLGVAELLQTLAFHHRSVLLEVENAEAAGRIAIRDGEVVDAETTARRGTDALFALLRTAQAGAFRIRELPPDATPSPQTIELSLNGILLRLLADMPPDTDAHATTTAQQVDGLARILSVQELLQIFEANQATAECLLARGNDPCARILLAEGGVAGAETVDARGAEAVYAVLGDTSLRYRVRPCSAPPVGAKRLDIAGLVMEGLRRLDEERLRRDELSLEHNVHARETLDRLAQGELDLPTRLALARRYLPGGEIAPAAVVARVAVDAEPTVREAALRTIVQFPEAIREAVAADPETPPPLLAYLLEHDAESAVREAAVANAATPAAALVAHVPSATETEVALLGEREALLRRSRDLRQALRTHPACRFRPRLEEMDRAEGPRLRTRAFTPPAETPAVVLETPEPDERTVSPPQRLGPRDIQYIARRGSLRQKIKLVCGNDAEVAVEIVKDPSLPETAVLSIAENTTAHPAALAHIAGERRYRRNAMILTALVFNPKTPVHASVPLLPLLRTDQVERLAGSRDVPDGLKQGAIGLLDKKKRKPKS